MTLQQLLTEERRVEKAQAAMDSRPVPNSARAIMEHLHGAKSLPPDLQRRACERAFSNLAAMPASEKSQVCLQVPGQIKQLHPDAQLDAWRLMLGQLNNLYGQAGTYSRHFLHAAVQELPMEMRTRVALYMAEADATDIHALEALVLTKTPAQVPAGDAARARAGASGAPHQSGA